MLRIIVLSQNIHWEKYFSDREAIGENFIHGLQAFPQWVADWLRGKHTYILDGFESYSMTNNRAIFSNWQLRQFTAHKDVTWNQMKMGVYRLYTLYFN